MYWYRLLWILLLMVSAVPIVAQDSDLPLISSNTQIITQEDLFGGETYAVSGELYNFGQEAYTSVNLYVEAYNDAGDIIGEGFGFLVDACGTALIDYAMPPDRLQTFNAPFELFEMEEVASVSVIPQATATDYQAPAPVDTVGVFQVSEEEVVMLEWLDDDVIIYGVGCDEWVFTELIWRQYTISDNDLINITHPDASFVTDAMVQQSGVTMISQSGEQDPELYNRSKLTFAPSARRAVFQNDIHTVISSEPDGSFKRLIHDKLHPYSLKGFVWAETPGVFLAYYFGSIGEPVRFFTANVEGNMLSATLENVEPSVIVPGPTADGTAQIVGGTFDDVTGYYVYSSFSNTRELLFEAELPDNNYPAPIVVDTAENRLIYVVRPVDGVPTLQCWNRNEGALSTLTPLPFTLTSEARAWSWISPNKSTLAISANGTSSGLWLVDLTEFENCGL